jgi:hypothetical protein
MLSTGCFLCSKKVVKIPVEVPCKLDTDMNLHPVQFLICGEDPGCKGLNYRNDVTAEELASLECYQCLDSENSANLAANVDWFMTWRQRMLDRCSPKPDDGKTGEKPKSESD